MSHEELRELLEHVRILQDAVIQLQQQVLILMKKVEEHEEDIHYCNDTCAKFPGHSGLRDPRETA